MKKLILVFITLLFSLITLNSTRAQLINDLSIENLYKLDDSKLIQISSYDTTGGNNDRINIHAGESRDIAVIDGPGIITRIWITIDSRDPHFLRRILLRMYWDDEKDPSVEVPVGDFFGTGFRYKHYFSQLVGMTSGGYISYFPMPFNKKARIEVVNETGQEVFAFYYQIAYRKLSKELDSNTAYFHAQWRRDIKTDYEESYKILEAEGEGKFIGVNMSMQPYKNSYWYLEGDEQIYVDGESFPSIHGTGLEDFFSSGWYFKDGEFHSPYHGLIIKEDSTKRVAVYRYMIGDAIPFSKSIKVMIEHGHGNEEVCDFSSTAFWYQKEPHKKFEPILKGSMRIPLRTIIPDGMIEGENLSVTGNVVNHIDDMTDYGAEWSGHKQLTVELKKNEEFSIDLNSLEDKFYDATIYFTEGAEYGDVDVLFDKKIIGKISATGQEVSPTGKLSLKKLKTQNDKIVLSFRYSSKNKKEKILIGLDGIKLIPKREYIKAWNLIGPFLNKRESDILRYGLDTVYPPEKEFDLTKTYVGVNDQVVKWKKIDTPANGHFNLWDKFEPFEFIVSYAVSFIYSPVEQEIPLYTGSDDGIKVFLNDEEIYRFLDVRIAAPDQDKLKLKLKKGWNKLTLKIENNFGGYGFFARTVDRQGNLKFSTNPK